jgi:antitoxin HicB
MLKYAIRIRYSPEDSTFVAEAPELPGCQADGPTPAKAAAALAEVAGLWIETARDEGRRVPEPDIVEKAYNGRVLVRLPSWLHRALDEGAAENVVSLNQYIATLLAASHATRKTADLVRAAAEPIVPAPSRARPKSTRRAATGGALRRKRRRAGRR